MKKTWVAVLAGAVLISGIGFGVNQMFAGEGEPALTEKEAVQKAEERYPGKVKEIELDDKGKRQVYEIELQGSKGEYEIKMDANSGEILKVEQEKKEANQNNQQKDDDQNDKGVKNQPAPEKSVNKQKLISKEQAKKIALSKFNGKFEEIELDKDDGRLKYEIELKNGNQEAEIEIDAYTGEILFMSTEDDD